MAEPKMKTLEQAKKRELIQLIVQIRWKAEAYDRTCEELGIKGNIIAHVKELRARVRELEELGHPMFI